MNLNSVNDIFHFIKIKVKKIKNMKKTKKKLEPPTIKQDKNPNYYYRWIGI